MFIDQDEVIRLCGVQELFRTLSDMEGHGVVLAVKVTTHDCGRSTEGSEAPLFLRPDGHTARKKTRPNLKLSLG